MKLTPLLTAAALALPLSVLPDVTVPQAATVTVRPSVTVRAPVVRPTVTPRINSRVNAGRAAMGAQRAAGVGMASRIPLGQAYRSTQHPDGLAYHPPYSTTGIFYPYWPIYLAASSSHSRAAANSKAVTPAERFLGATRPGANTCEIHQLTANLGDKLPTLDAKLAFIRQFAESANVPVSDEQAAQFQKMEGIWAAACPVPSPVKPEDAPAPQN